jgi:5-enolpyruvylshikimate-3-phosphate synthase
MALSIVSILGIDVTLDDSQCVQKSFPTFWKELEKIGFLFT